MTKLRFHFNWKITLLVAAFLPIFIKAGFWQLDRAEQKRAKGQSYQEALLQPAKNLAQLNTEDISIYQNVIAEGQLNTRFLLLDNQIHQQQFGYEVLQLMQLADGRHLMISRGWVPGDLDRRILPEINPIEGQQQLSGYLYPLSQNPWLNVDLVPKTATVIPIIDPVLLAKILGKDPLAFVLRLTAPDQHLFESHWQRITLPPEKHTAYAFQWFAIAFIVLLIFFWQSMDKKS